MTEITVDKALRKGRLLLIYIPVGIMIGSFFSTLFFLNYGNPFLIFLTCFVTGFILGMLFWCIMVTKWRIWAFRNVRNVHELKKAALQEGMIYSNRFLEKLEIKTASDKQKWQSILEKFKYEDIFIDDPSVPYETQIFYRKTSLFTMLISGSIVLAIGIYVLLKHEFGLGLFSSIIGAVMLLIYSPRAKEKLRSVQLILSERGIYVLNSDFFDWSDIHGEKIVAFGGNRYLVFDHPNGTMEVQITDLTSSSLRQMAKLLRTYRQRFEYKKNKL